MQKSGIIIVAESGATKTDWRAGGCSMRTGGINLSVMPEADIRMIVADAIRNLAVDAGAVSKVCFYAAGLVSGCSSVALERIFHELCPMAEVEFQTDLMAASRALWGNCPGVTAILGTGSNSCLYDGTGIVRNVRPGGYILGDEGGGVSAGRRFVADFIKDLMPAGLSADFRNRYGLDYGTIVENVYKGSNPSGYLASFAPYILEKSGEYEYARNLVKENFRDFITRSLLSYRSGDAELDTGVAGAFGCAGRDILCETGAGYGVRFVKFIETPIDHLSVYHENLIFAGH